jgi:hypothetical protein
MTWKRCQASVATEKFHSLLGGAFRLCFACPRAPREKALVVNVPQGRFKVVCHALVVCEADIPEQARVQSVVAGQGVDATRHIPRFPPSRISVNLNEVQFIALFHAFSRGFGQALADGVPVFDDLVQKRAGQQRTFEQILHEPKLTPRTTGLRLG